MESFRWFDFWRGCAVSAGFIPVARSVSRTLTSKSRGGATAASRCKESGGQRAAAVLRGEKERRDGKGLQREREREKTG